MPQPPVPVLSPSDQRHWLESIYRSDRRTNGEQRRTHTYGSGETIWMEAEKIWVVCRGVVQLSVLHPSGDEVLLGLAGPSMPFGAPLTILGSYSAKALTSVELLCFAMAEVETSPHLAQELFRHATRRLCQTEAVLAITSHRRIEDRLRHLLLLLKQEVGQPTPNGIRLSVKLTHQQLANAIGTSRVTITRLLGKLREEKWVKLDRDRHLIITAPHNFA